MEPIKKGQLKDIIDSAYVIRLDNGETQELITKGESYCHFFKPIIIENYEVHFRVDWSDIGKGGHPTLDTDFYDITTRKKFKNKGLLRKAHHTKIVDPNVRNYEWQFEKEKWPFKVVVRWLIEAGENIPISDSATCEVVRNGIKIED